jgi:hypothetical protein
MWVLRKALAAVALGWVCASGVHALDFGGVNVSADTRYVAQWVVDSRDNRGKPFVIVDKKAAKVFIFGPGGAMVGAAPALLGMAVGDHAVAGVGALPPSRIPRADRTTPAGRFETEAGINLDGEDVIWIDYDAGLAIHRVRPDAAQQLRLRRLASAAPDEHRVSAGCVVLPVGFYENVLKPTLARSNGIVYVLPEMRPVREMFGRHAADL